MSTKVKSTKKSATNGKAKPKTPRRKKSAIACATYRSMDRERGNVTPKDTVFLAFLATDDNVDVVAMADRLPGLCKPHENQDGDKETASEARQRAERTIKTWLSAFRYGGRSVGYPRSAKEPANLKKLVSILKRNEVSVTLLKKVNAAPCKQNR